jgi:hypothetical protein
VVFVKSFLQLFSKISCKNILTTTYRCIIVKTTNGALLSVVEFAAVGHCGAGSFGGNGMNWELIKHKFCRLVVTASLLLGGVMVSAAASGTMPLWAALLGLFAAVVMLNAACGILLGTPAAEPRRAVPARTSRPAVQLCVVRSGHAA